MGQVSFIIVCYKAVAPIGALEPQFPGASITSFLSRVG